MYRLRIVVVTPSFLTRSETKPGMNSMEELNIIRPPRALIADDVFVAKVTLCQRLTGVHRRYIHYLLEVETDAEILY